MLSSIQAAVLAFLGAAVTLVVALVPSIAPFQQEIIAAVGGAVTLAFLVASAVITHAHAKVAAAREARGVQTGRFKV